MLLFMPPYCRCHSDMYDVIRLHYDQAVTSQLFWLAPLSDEILDVVTSKSPVTRPGIFRLVAQRLNHYATPGPTGRSSIQYYKIKFPDLNEITHLDVLCLL
jgi:hypothetical protein